MAEFATDVPTLRFVPGGAKGAVAQASEALCEAVLRAHPETQDAERAWKLLVLRERLLLFAPLRHGRNARREARATPADRARLVRERVALLERGEWQSLLEAARASGRGLALARRAAPAERSEQTLADEVLRKVLAEEFSRAAQLLGSPGLAPHTPETAQRM